MTTLDHYNRTAQRYVEVNHTLPSAAIDRAHFLEHLATVPQDTPGAPRRILDAGSGSGRDTLAFRDMGHDVDAFDGAPAMAAVSSQLTGQYTRVMTFEELDLTADHYDGIWAMASLLHVARQDMAQVFVDLGRALKPGGVMFASFKAGCTDRVDERDGRVFVDMNADEVRSVLERIEGFELLATRERPAGTGQTNAAPWFSCVVRRTGPAPTLVVSTARPKPR